MPSSSGYVPPKLLGSKEFTSDDKVAYMSLVAVGIDGAHSVSVGSNCGLKPSVTRASLEKLAVAGWARKEGVKFFPNLSPVVVEKPAEKIDIFSEKNRVIDNPSIAAVIKEFVDAGLNPEYASDKSKAYSSPWNRRAAEKLVHERGLDAVTEMIRSLGLAKGSERRPLTRNVSELARKWDNCEAFLRISNKNTAVVL